MKILFITQYYLPQNTGGTELYIYNLCRGLKQLHVASAVCCSAPNLHKGSYFHEGIMVHSSASHVELVEQISQLVNKEGFTVLHIHTMGGNLSNSLLDWLNGLAVPVFFTPHLVNNFCLNQGKLLYKNRILCNGYVSRIKCQTCISAVNPGIPFFYKNKLFQFVVQLLHSITVEKWLPSFHLLASEMKNRICVIKKTKVQIIPIATWYESVLDVNELPYVPFVHQAVSDDFLEEEPTAFVEEGFKWVFAGRLSAEKGLSELVELFRGNALPGDQLILFLFISKQMGEFEQELLSTLKNQTNVVVYANKMAADVAAIMKNCDCLVLPTKICEMAPLVIREAFSLHIPVLVSEFIRESIESKQGVKFSYDQLGDFTNKFNYMRLHSREMKATGFSGYEPKSFLSVAQQHLQVYKEALATS